jgi:hypothetical protein
VNIEGKIDQRSEKTARKDKAAWNGDAWPMRTAVLDGSRGWRAEGGEGRVRSAATGRTPSRDWAVLKRLEDELRETRRNYNELLDAYMELEREAVRTGAVDRLHADLLARDDGLRLTLSREEYEERLAVLTDACAFDVEFGRPKFHPRYETDGPPSQGAGRGGRPRRGH